MNSKERLVNVSSHLLQFMNTAATLIHWAMLFTHNSV